MYKDVAHLTVIKTEAGRFCKKFLAPRIYGLAMSAKNSHADGDADYRTNNDSMRYDSPSRFYKIQNNCILPFCSCAFLELLPKQHPILS